MFEPPPACRAQPIIDSATYGAVVIMVVLTTLVTPPLIKWRFSRLEAPL